LCTCALAAHAQTLLPACRSAQHAGRDSLRVADSTAISLEQRMDVQVSRSENSDYIPAWHDMFTRVPGDWGRFVGDNFRVERIPAIAGLAGLTAALIIADNETWSSTNHFSNGSVSRKDATQFFVELGNGRTVLALAGGFAIAGWTSDDNRALRTASQLVESYLACGITVQVLKHITGRERPERRTRPRGKWDFFPNQAAYHRSVPKFDAFPSGHTAAAMAMVTVLIENYPEATWLKPVGYGVVGLVGFGLVAKGWHWYSDFPLAIVLGYQFGKLAAHPEGVDVVKGDEQNSTKLTVAPAFGVDGAGVTVAIQF